MLASIVIRMALQDTFAYNSAVLALDEPTTNLDQDHIALLAKFLSNIIESRKESDDFQLVIITHDH